MANISVPNVFTSSTTIIAERLNENYGVFSSGIASGANNFKFMASRAQNASFTSARVNTSFVGAYSGPSGSTLNIIGARIGGGTATIDEYRAGTFSAGMTGTVDDVRVNDWKYTKIGRLVHIRTDYTLNSLSTGAEFYVTGIPSYLCPAAGFTSYFIVYVMFNQARYVSASRVSSSGTLKVTLPPPFHTTVPTAGLLIGILLCEFQYFL